MFEMIYARNLGNPKGIIGRKVAKWFEQNLSCYTYLEKIEDLSKYKEILEIGYGNGSGINELASSYSMHIDGIDISRPIFYTWNSEILTG